MDRRATIEPAVEEGARLVISGIVWCDHPALEASAQLRDRDPLRSMARVAALLPFDPFPMDDFLGLG